MQIRCYRCGWSFSIKREEAAFALQALEETGGTHYDTSCPRCRHSNRVSLEQLRKAAPRAADEPSRTETQDAGEIDETKVVAEDQEPEAIVDDPETGE